MLRCNEMADNYNKFKLNEYKHGIIINFINFKILFLLIIL